MMILTELETDLPMAIPKAITLFAGKPKGEILGTKVLTAIPSGGLTFTQLTVKENVEEVATKSGGFLILLVDIDRSPIALNPGSIMLIHRNKEELLGSMILTTLPSKQGGGMTFKVFESVESIVDSIRKAQALRQEPKGTKIVVN
jgi:hypothetical protein